MKNWIKHKLMSWLGLFELAAQIENQKFEICRLSNLYRDLVSIGVDVHFKEPHMILIYSRLNGGQLREVRAHFNDLNELHGFVRELKDRFNTTAETWDGPSMIEEFRRRKGDCF